MQYLNLQTATLDSPQFLGSEPTDRATWLCLLRYCAGQENGGTIADCADWSDRKWQQLARVTLAEVKRESDLWQWRGKTVAVWSYPSENEARAKTLRARGKAAIEARWAAKATNGKNGHKHASGEAYKKKDGHPGTDLIHAKSPRLDPARQAPREVPE